TFQQSRTLHALKAFRLSSSYAQLQFGQLSAQQAWSSIFFHVNNFLDISLFDLCAKSIHLHSLF
ncbi:hypothetical protein, partial [Enterobacter cloacae]|uniref:hypothetical protein n=1 Tax=Enterobacter cloacae TaxID=550 RepID=UPI000BE735EF